MIIITGGAGMIGSNLIAALNRLGRRDIIVVDNLTDGRKIHNLADVDIADYLDKNDFRKLLEANHDFQAEVVFHQGACSATTQWDGRYMLDNNYAFSKTLLDYCQTRDIALIYASSAAVYGSGSTFTEGQGEVPINVYGYSKKLFDHYLRQRFEQLSAKVIGLRYFNVYGPKEAHKGSMASVAYHQHLAMQRAEAPKLFGPYGGYAAGQQMRDFIHVDDVVAVNLWCWQHCQNSGIFNCGTGQAQPFQDIANAVIKFYGRGEVEYIDFPDHLRGSYQCFTQADISALRRAGYDGTFRNVAQGVDEYLTWLNAT